VIDNSTVISLNFACTMAVPVFNGRMLPFSAATNAITSPPEKMDHVISSEVVTSSLELYSEPVDARSCTSPWASEMVRDGPPSKDTPSAVESYVRSTDLFPHDAFKLVLPTVTPFT